jgi:hypothetical protein
MIQSINKSIYKYPTTLWIKFWPKVKSMHFYCHVYSKLNLNTICSSQGMRQIYYFLFLTVVHSEGKTTGNLWDWQSMKMSRLSSLLQERSSQFPCGVCFFLRQSFQNVSNFLSNIPYMRGFTEYEPATLRTSAKYRIQTFFINKWRSLAMVKIKSTEKEIFPTP